MTDPRHRVSRRALLAAAPAALASFAAVASRTAAAATAPDAPTADLLTRISRARASIRTLQGPFTQTRTIGLLTTDVRSTGTLTLVVPDRLRWQLAAPDDVTFWVGPEGLAYRSAHGQGRIPATTARLAAALRDLHALLGGDLGRLQDRWSLQALRDDVGGAELEAIARPLATAPPATTDGTAPRAPLRRSMRFTLAADLVRPTRALLAEGEHDRTAIDFGDLKVNAPVEDGAMHPPA